MFRYSNAIPSAMIAVDRALNVCFINPAAEMLFGISAQQTLGRELITLPAIGEDICNLCERAFQSGEEITLFEQQLPLPFHHRLVTMHISPVMVAGMHMPEQLLITIEKGGELDHRAASEWKQEATRAAGVMAAMLAHEVKNPLSGIRGAAQLLKEEVAPEHQALAELICRETDRIRDLLSAVEVFDDGVPDKQPVNIHEVLQYVIAIATSGFAQGVAFKERYDPSLPLVLGQRDLLIQLFLNLVKNASEALSGRPDATITITTGYRSFSRMRLGHGDTALPIMVTIEDNGPGIDASVQAHLFEPFLSSKEEGRGLGLAIVAKIASDLGAVVELDREFNDGTRFILSFMCS